ncbi:MAG: carbohydrate-binding domain-containing protein [Clostridiales bacterium]|nr:carbohydrate-binding domain-containing protein [Clostridiales bacterium]
MKQAKAFTAILLTGALLAGSLSGCGNKNSASLSDDASAKGLKAGMALTIEGGIFDLNCADDAIHSNGNVTIMDGTFEISTGDDAVHADETSTISGGTLNIDKCCEGIEGVSVDISGGEITIVASNDGLNAANGTATVPGVGTSDGIIRISGGTVCIHASGDGLDSNGDLDVTGGQNYVSPTAWQMQPWTMTARLPSPPVRSSPWATAAWPRTSARIPPRGLFW